MKARGRIENRILLPVGGYEKSIWYCDEDNSTTKRALSILPKVPTICKPYNTTGMVRKGYPRRWGGGHAKRASIGRLKEQSQP